MTIGNGSANEDSIASSDNNATITKTGVGTLAVNSSMDSFVGTLNVNEGVMNLRNKISASAINVADGADFNVAFAQGNVGSYILNATSITGISADNKLNVGFDLRNNGSDLLGTTTSIFKEGSATADYEIAGSGTFAVGNMFLTYSDNNGTVTIGDTLTIGNPSAGGTQATIVKNVDTGSTTLTTTSNQPEVVVENTKQTVNEVVATESSLIVGQNSEVKTDKLSTGSTIVVNDDTAKVEIASAMADTSKVEITAGKVAVSGITTTESGSRDTTIASTGADINASAGNVVVQDTNKNLVLVGDITVASGKQLEINAGLSVSGEKLITSTGSEAKLQSTITLADTASKLTLAGNTSGKASFVGATDGTNKSSIVVSGLLSVGNSPAVVSYKDVNVNFGEITEHTNVLKMEVFGTGNVAGKDFDRVVLDNASLDFGSGEASTGRIEIVVDSQDDTSFSAGTFEIQLFELSGGASISGLESGDVSIVLAGTLKDNWEAVFASTGTKELTDAIALETLMNTGTVSLTFTQIPEPATLAAILGALTLSFAAYRRRK